MTTRVTHPAAFSKKREKKRKKKKRKKKRTPINISIGEKKEDTHKYLNWKKRLSFFVIFVFRPFLASPQVGIAVVATDRNC